jgi:glycosyltransferase involved in cell wall biosynthesis
MRILFMSPHCLLDTSSGAALSMMKQLELLTDRGWSCRVVTGSVFDSEAQVDQDSILALWGVREFGAIGPRKIRGVTLKGVEHTILSFTDSRRHYVTAVEEYLFFHLVKQQLNEWQPTIVYCYGGWLLERSLLRLARERGIPTLFLLTNNNYDDPSAFADVDQIFTPTRLLAEQYYKRLGISAIPVGEFADTSATMADRSSPDRVTFINPAPEKGVALFIEIARQALVRLPKLRFLVVQSRWTREMVTELFGTDWGTLPNIEFIPQQQDMRSVYARTWALLFPTFWFEAAGRTLLEAQANGIPVLASSHGGIVESLAGGGFLFDIPERCRNDIRESPLPEEVVPWVDCLEELLGNAEIYNDAEKRALVAAKNHDVNELADVMDSRLRELLDATGSRYK